MVEVDTPTGDFFFTDPRMIKFQVSQWTIKKTANETINRIVDYDMEICNQKHFQKLDDETKAYFLNKHLADFFCIPTHIKNLTMEGAFDQDIFQAIRFTMSICKNGTGNVVCLPEREIRAKMARGFVGVYFVDNTINPGNYLNPSLPQPREVFTNFVLDSQRQLDINLKNNFLETEDGVVFQEKKEERIINYHGYQEFDFKTQSDDFFWVYFKVKQVNSFFKRKYSKVQDLLAQIGGFVNCFWIVSFALNYLYSQLYIISEILYDIFTIKIKKEIDPNRANNYFAKDKSKIQPNMSQINYGYNDKIQLSILDYIHYYTGFFGFKKQKEKKIIIEKGMKIVQNCLDVKFMIKKFYELEKMKQLLLKPEDLMKFEKMDKPILEIDLSRKLRSDGTMMASFFGRNKSITKKVTNLESRKVPKSEHNEKVSLNS